MAWVMAAMAVAGAVGNMRSAGKARKEARRAADAYVEQMNEKIRIQRRQHRFTHARTMASNYASGVQYSGSRKNVTRDNQEEMAREIKWMQKVRDTTERAIRRGADVQHEAAMWQSATSAVGALGNAASTQWGKSSPITSGGGTTGSSWTRATGTSSWQGTSAYNPAGWKMNNGSQFTIRR